MKNLLLLCAVCAFCSAGAFGQSAFGGGAMSAQPVIFTIADHPQHASQTGMAPEQSILEHSESVSAHGERPLWECMPEEQFVSLGAIAREYREQHASNKKASVVWKNQ
jgi:hypothetical protein